MAFSLLPLLSLRSREDLPFDAILCANDNTAAGVLTAFEQIGVKVSDDVAIFGFDNSQVSLACFPTISTIDQYASETGFKAAQMAYNLLDGKEVPDEVVIDSYPIYRQSCGCVDATSRTSSYVDRQGNYHATDAKDNFASFNHTRSQFASVYYFLNMMDSDSHFDDFLNNIHNYAKQGGVPAIAMSFYDHPVTLNREDIFTLPASARLFCLYNETKNINKNFLC